MEAWTRERGSLTQRTGVPHAGALTIRGREFSLGDLQKIRQIVEDLSGSHRFALSKAVCRALGWYQPNGRLKDRACRDVLAKLQDLGVLRLPPPRRPGVRRRPIPSTERTAPRQQLSLRARDVHASSFVVVTGSKDATRERLWNEYVERYHDLGYGVPLGAHIKYFATFAGEPIACLAFGGAAWRVEVRDDWIGWSDEQRKRNLRYVVNNTRFLILPWVQAKNLASRLLALAARRVRDDWLRLYAYRPLLLETFVHAERYRGTCYRAANWTCLGLTKGRGRMDRRFRAKLPRKTVWVHPLAADAPRLLRTR